MKKFGLIGWPISHSLSPEIHNQAFEKSGLDWTYILLPTKPEDLKQVVADFRTQKFSGANVTVPHKESIMAYLDAVTLTAQKIGAVNTLYWDRDKLTGDNTDAAGFLEDLQEKDIKLRNKSVLILGTGGSAKAIKVAVEQAGAMVETWTRKNNLPVVPREININCTPGLDPEVLARICFKPGQVLYDLVYVPEETPLMQKALQEGAQAFNGKGMLLKQAALSFKIWKQSLLKL
ncbi:MAG: shikimate dehydrogenase [Myxococcaceae bacterium]